MIRVNFEDLIPGNIYYDVDEPTVTPAKFRLHKKTGSKCVFIGVSNCGMYSAEDDGLYVFNSMHFYKNEFKFGR